MCGFHNLPIYCSFDYLLFIKEHGYESLQIGIFADHRETQRMNEKNKKTLKIQNSEYDRNSQ